MDSVNLLTYLDRRQRGYDGAGSKKNVYDMFIGQLGHKSQRNHSCCTCDTPIDVGNTFACKFSRNKNNLHMVCVSTEHGELIIVNSLNESRNGYNDSLPYERQSVHCNAIFNFSWAQPQMKLVTACGDHSSKLCNMHPSGKIDVLRRFISDSSVKSVMFRPGSSDVFCGGYQDGTIKIWDARINNRSCVSKFDLSIPNAHGDYVSFYKNKKPKKMFGISTVIYKDDLTVLSCSSMDPCIKLWDLRKSYRQITGNKEPLPLAKYFHNMQTRQNVGYIDMIINPQSTRLYASGANNIIHCYSLESLEKMPICQYSGHRHETSYSKISLSNDGRYLFSGCTDKSGVIWSTDFPFKEKPIFEVSDPSKELSVSDWCADSSTLKLAVSADSMPKIFSIFRQGEKRLDLKMRRTVSYESKSFSKFYTAPIKAEIKIKHQKETEEDMEIWDLQNQNKITTVNNLPVTPKNEWEVLFTKTTPLLNSQTSPQTDTTTLTHSPPVVNNENPDIVTPVSNRKRKKSTLSPRSLIDQYLVSNSKREKLDTVNEM